MSSSASSWRPADVVGVALARDLESLQDKWRRFPRPRRKPWWWRRSTSRWRRPTRRRPGGGSRLDAQVHRAEIVTPRPQGRRREGAAATSNGAFASISKPSPSRPTTPRACRRKRGGSHDRNRRDIAPLRRAGDGFAPRSRRAVEMAENTKADPDFRVPSVDWDRTGKDVLTLSGSTARRCTNAPRSRPRASTSSTCRMR
jgi:ubiquinone biosynthesis protein